MGCGVEFGREGFADAGSSGERGWGVVVFIRFRGIVVFQIHMFGRNATRMAACGSIGGPE